MTVSSNDCVRFSLVPAIEARHDGVMEDAQRYKAVAARDARFDGVFYTGVRTTGIYCRPSCPAITPHRQNVSFYPTAAAAQAAGFRACLRCRPDTSPGDPAWDVRGDVVARAMRLIGDGVVEQDGVAGLSRRLGYAQRHLNRMMTAELGAGPLAIARTRRAQAARILLETTTMPVTEVAFAAGFGSVRQFNDTIRTTYGRSPSALRRRRGPAPSGVVQVRLAVRQPFHSEGLLEFLGARCIPGVESVEARTYARIVRLPRGLGAVALTLHGDHVAAELDVRDVRDMQVAVARARRLLDLDADPIAIDESLATGALLPLVQAAPGMRLPGQTDGFEVAVRAVIGQQISVARARTMLGHLAEAYGEPFTSDLAERHGLVKAFPSAQTMAERDLTGMPRARSATIRELARLVASGDLDLGPGADREASRERLLAVRGVGPWTAGYIAMRALGDPDQLLPTDLVIARMLDRLGLRSDDATGWSPWRSYAALHLWRLSTRSEQ